MAYAFVVSLLNIISNSKGQWLELIFFAAGCWFDFSSKLSVLVRVCLNMQTTSGHGFCLTYSMYHNDNIPDYLKKEQGSRVCEMEIQSAHLTKKLFYGSK